MPADYMIQRQVGTVNEILPIFIGNITTGAGLTNIVASTVGFSWYRNDMATASSGTCTNGSLGTYSASSFLQVLSTGMRGWYTFGIPNSVFVSGRSAAIRLSSAVMEVNVFIELSKTDNQTYMSSQSLSTNALVNINQVLGSTPVTTAPGIFATHWDLGRTSNIASTLTLTGTTISTNQLVNVNRILGSTPVTTAPGTYSVGITGTQTYNITGNISGSVGSVTGSVASVVGLTPAFLDVSVSSRLATASYTAPLTEAGTRTAVGLSTASLDDQLSRVATTTQAAAIQAKTDGLNYTVVGQVDANIKSVNDVTVNGDGSAGTPWGP